MRARLEKIIAQLRTELERAEGFAGSDNETTADRYSAVVDGIEEAIAALEDACGNWD